MHQPTTLQSRNGGTDRFAIYERYCHLYAEPSGRHAWTPMRFCQEDWILAVWVYRRFRDRYEVALFEAEDHRKFVRDSGVTAGIIMLLSDAYHGIGCMELHFIAPPQGHEPTLPGSMRRIATAQGITLAHPHRIADAEGRALYIALSGIPTQSLGALEQSDIDPVRVAFAVQRGIWSGDTVRFLAASALDPEALFAGGALPEDRLFHQADQAVLRTAVLAERFLALLQQDSPAPTVSMTWTQADEWTLDVLQDVELMTAAGAARFQAGQQLSVIVWPANAREYQRVLIHHGDVLHKAQVLAVTRDFLDYEHHHDFPQAVPVPDSLEDIDEETLARLQRAESTRRPVPEQPD